MLKNFFKLTLFLVMTIFCGTNNLRGETQTQSNKKNFSVQDIYYKENPWDFVENKLMIKEGWSKKLAITADCGIFLISVCCNIWVSWIVVKLLANRRMDLDTEMLLNLITSIFGIISAVLITRNFHKYVTSPSYREAIRIEDIISILQSYDPDLSGSNTKNTKLYVPKELNSLFDALWMIYKERGEQFFKAEWDKVAEKIMNKIQHDIKSMKYQ